VEVERGTVVNHGRAEKNLVTTYGTRAKSKRQKEEEVGVGEKKWHR